MYIKNTYTAVCWEGFSSVFYEIRDKKLKSTWGTGIFDFPSYYEWNETKQKLQWHFLSFHFHYHFDEDS